MVGISRWGRRACTQAGNICDKQVCNKQNELKQNIGGCLILLKTSIWITLHNVQFQVIKPWSNNHNTSKQKVHGSLYTVFQLGLESLHLWQYYNWYCNSISRISWPKLSTNNSFNGCIQTQTITSLWQCHLVPDFSYQSLDISSALQPRVGDY